MEVNPISHIPAVSVREAAGSSEVYGHDGQVAIGGMPYREDQVITLGTYPFTFSSEFDAQPSDSDLVSGFLRDVHAGVLDAAERHLGDQYRGSDVSIGYSFTTQNGGRGEVTFYRGTTLDEECERRRERCSEN